MKIAVCICTCNRPSSLDRLLAALRHAEFDSERIEHVGVVVVDNLPDGRARKIARDHKARLGVPLWFVEEPQRGISFARNRALAEALAHGADFVAFLDDDDVPQNDWLTKLIDKQSKSDADIVMGVWRLPSGYRVPKHLAGIGRLNGGNFDRPTRFGIPKCGCNVLIGRSAIERLETPWYRPEYALVGGEDTDFFVRAHRAGAKVVQTHDSVVLKDPGEQRATLRGILRDAFRIGCARTQLNLQHLPTDQRRRIRLRAGKRLLKSIMRLSPFSLTRSVVALDRIVKATGELYGTFGGTYAYYASASEARGDCSVERSPKAEQR